LFIAGAVLMLPSDPTL